MAQIKRTGTVNFHDASLSVWEEGIAEARAAGGIKGADQWEREFKRDVFARIVQQLRRLGWTVSMPAIDPHDVQHYGGTVARWAAERRRNCHKGALKGELEISGRAIKFKMWQSVNTPTRPDHDGKYESDKEGVMPYVLRLEMTRTRNRLRDYLCNNVFAGYEFVPSRISSPNPDPLAYFNDSWDSEYEKKRGTHRFSRGPDGWPDDSCLKSWKQTDADGVRLNHGDTRYWRDRKGRLIRGRVYGGINGMWMAVYGPGKRDHTHKSAHEFFSLKPGMPRKRVREDDRRKRLESELAKSVKEMNFERAAVLRDILFPKSKQTFLVWHEREKAYHRPCFQGYTANAIDAGRFTREECNGYDRAPNRLIPQGLSA
ncbi:UvrB/UvrC motif-containing protein [Uliginosibacterium sediminicola]|uniref:UvrB/UvrC motif-containing protein n=1 Tax=Uliginosibacterium sediminicola TaxID=2024550 RepID=A0ABU9YVW8_9RHOO